MSRAYRCAVIGLTAYLCACKPNMVREPYPVEVVREVVKPIPSVLTDELPTPVLPDGPLTVLALIEHIKAWQAWAKVAADHRARVAELSKGQ